MKKIFAFVSNNVYKYLAIVAIGGLVISNMHFMVRAQEKVEENPAPSSDQSPIDILESLPIAAQSSVTYSMPNASCFTDVFYNGTTSATFNPNAPYSIHQFWTNVNEPNYHAYQDVNGDNLPDLIAASNRSTGASYNGQPAIVNTTMGCVHLNNGQGWSKAFQCYGRSYTDQSTGALLFSEFKGDCAG